MSLKNVYKTTPLLFFIIIVNLLSGCGGDTGLIINTPIKTPPKQWTKNQFYSDSDSFYKNKCANPRTSTNPVSGKSYNDRQGTELDEKNWLRSWNNDIYLWYKEVADQDPALAGSPVEYFSTLKTFARTPSGKKKDQFHFTLPTDDYLKQSQSGVTSGYGATFTFTSSKIPRELVVSYTQPNSPATSALVNLKRGTKILEVDGTDLVYSTSKADQSILLGGLFPKNDRESHTFKVQDYGSNQVRTITMTSSEVTLQPVQKARIINTQTGKVGYMLFNEHIATAESQLINAISQFQNENISDLVIDLRYNGGGVLYIALELASMIAGSDMTRNQYFGKLEFNDKHTQTDPFDHQPIRQEPFLTHSFSFSETPNQKLPNLDLSRIFIITGGSTCSASEEFINALRGIDLEVIQIGSTTCGKPYGFRPTDNCGTSYFSISFRGVNNKGFGDYADGFSPVNTLKNAGVRLAGCSVADDFTHQLGDPLERRLSAALAYRNGGCPALSARPTSSFGVEENTMKPFWLKNTIVN